MNRWMWTPEQWSEIVRCARSATECRRGARAARTLVRCGGEYLPKALELEATARRRERRVRVLASQWGVL